MATRERSFSANAAFSVLGWALPAVAALIAIPITVEGLGAEQYGLLALTAALTGYLGLMEMGLGTAIMRYLSYYRALRQGRPMLGVIMFGLRWFTVAGVVGMVFLIVAAPWLSSSVLDVSEDLQSTSVTVIRLTGVSFYVALLVSVGTAIPQSFLRYDISSAMNASIGTLSAVGPAVLVVLGYGLVAVVVFSLAVNIVALAIYAFIGYRLMRSVPWSEGPPWKEIRRKTLTFAGLTAINQVGQTVAAQTNRLVVGIASGVEAAAYYQVPNMLASRVNDMLSRVAQVLFPTASGLLARDDLKAVQGLYMHSSRLFFVLNFSVTMALCVLSYPLLEYWVNVEFATQGAVALVIFSISQSLHATTMAASYINLSAARPGINVVFSNVANAISLIVLYPLTVRYGINGAAFAGLVAALNVPFFLHYGHRHVLDLSSWLVWRKCYQPTVLGTGLAGAAAYFLLRPLCNSLVTTLALWCLTVLASIVAAGLFGAVTRDDVRSARHLLASPWRRLRARRG